MNAQNDNHLARRYMPASFDQSLHTTARLVVNHSPAILKNRYMQWFLYLVQQYQWIGFAMNATTFPGIPGFLDAIFHPARALWSFGNYSTYAAGTIAAAACLVIVPAILFFAMAIRVHRGLVLSRRVLAFLNASQTVVITVCQVQLLQLFVAGIACSSGGLLLVFPAISCASPQHAGVLTTCIIALLILLPAIVLGPTAFAIYAPNSPSIFATTRAAPNQYMALLGVALVVLERFSIAIDPWLGQWALIVVGLCGMAPIAFGPLLHSHVPASYFISATAISSGAMACAWATMLTAAIVNAIALNSLDPTRWVTALAVGVVTGLIVAVATWVVSMRNAERCVRAWFQVARTSAAAVPWSKVAGIATVQDPKSRNAVLDQIGRPFTGKPLGSTAELSISRSAQISPATGATVADADGDAGGPRANKGTISTDAINLLRVRDEPPRRQVFESPHQVEFAIRFVRYNPTPSQLSLGLHLLFAGLSEFPNSFELKLLAAQYLSIYFGTQGQASAARLLRDLEQMSEAGTVRRFLGSNARYMLWCHLHESHMCTLALSASQTGKSIGSSAIAAVAKQHHLQALHSARDFWETIRTGAGASRANSAIRNFSASASRSSKAYQELIAASPRDVSLLRQYAGFLSCVESDSYRATNMMELAEELEYEGHKARESDDVITEEMDANSMEEVGDKMDSSPAPHKERWNSNADSEQEHTQIIKIKRSGSVSSSGSSSRNVGRRQHLRGLMYDRLVAPLQRHWLLTIFAVAFIVTLAGGINASFGFYKRSSSVFTTYAQMRPTRVSSVAVIENLRGMVFSNLVGNPAQFATWSSGLKSKGIDPYLAAIPALAAQLAIDTNPPVYRAYVARKSSSISDYTVEDLLASDLLNTVVEGAQIALNYMNYGALTPSVVASISELRFLTDNWEPVILACRDMLKAPLNDYIVTNGSIALLLWCWFAGSLAVLLMALALVDRKLLHEFFNNQTIVVGLVQQVPRIAAADLVMQFEEAIEDFIAINGVDDGEDGLNVRGAGNVQKQLEKASLSTSRSGSSTNRQSERLESRTRQIKTRIIAGIAVIALSVASIYIFTLRTLDIASYVEYLIQSTDRRQNIITLRLVTREFFSGSSAIDPGLLVTMARGQISDTLALHNELTGPLALFMPNETRWTRDCTPTSPLYCATMVENSSIGWTRSLASVTMDTEILRFLQVATTVVDGMAAIPRPNPLDTSSALYKNWLLLLALSSDLQTRIFNAHSTLINTSQLEINANQAGTVVMFVTALVIAAAGYATLYFGVLRPLHRDAHAVITLIHHVPEPVVQKDVPKLLRFMESGGASLEVAASGEEDAAM